MSYLSQVQEHFEVIGADGVHVGTVDHVAGARIKLTKAGSSDRRHHFIDGGLIAGVEGDRVRLSAAAADVVMFEETDPSERESDLLDEGLEETFPASDPVSAKHIT